MLAEFEDGERMSDTELRDQLMTLLLAGTRDHRDRTGLDLRSAAASPERAGPSARVPRGWGGGLPAGDDRRVPAPAPRGPPCRPPPLQRAHRRRPHRSGTDVTPAIWLTHTRADIYPEPFAFKPERFLEDGPDTYAWIPFGGGVRRCLGASFAEFEMRIVLREVLTRCDLHKANWPRRRPAAATSPSRRRRAPR